MTRLRQKRRQLDEMMVVGGHLELVSGTSVSGPRGRLRMAGCPESGLGHASPAGARGPNLSTVLSPVDLRGLSVQAL